MCLFRQRCRCKRFYLSGRGLHVHFYWRGTLDVYIGIVKSIEPNGVFFGAVDGDSNSRLRSQFGSSVFVEWRRLLKIREETLKGEPQSPWQGCGGRSIKDSEFVPFGGGSKIKSFFIKFNVMWLGSLFFLLLFISSIQHSARFSPSDSLMWSTKYLDGIVVGMVAMGLLLLGLLSWFYALWKSWKLTRSNKLICAQRALVFGYLLGAPVFLKFTGIYWLSAMRVITDKLVHVI